MKTVIPFVMVVLLSCTTRQTMNEETDTLPADAVAGTRTEASDSLLSSVTQDPVGHDDQDSIEPVEYIAEAVDTGAVNKKIALLLGGYKNSSKLDVKIEVLESDNLYVSDSYWLLNPDMSKKFFRELWNLHDGGSGTRYLFYENDELAGAWDEEIAPAGARYFSIVYENTPGASYSRDSERDPVKAVPLDNEYLYSLRDQFDGRFTSLLERLQTGQVKALDSETVVVEITENYDAGGENVTSTFKATMPRSAYETLTRQARAGAQR